MIKYILHAFTSEVEYINFLNKTQNNGYTIVNISFLEIKGVLTIYLTVSYTE